MTGSSVLTLADVHKGRSLHSAETRPSLSLRLEALVVQLQTPQSFPATKIIFFLKGRFFGEWDRPLATLSASRGQASVGSPSPSAGAYPGTRCRGHEGELSLGGKGRRAGAVSSPWCALCRKPRRAEPLGSAATEEVVLTVAFSPRTFLTRMDLAVRKARGHQQ